MMTKEKMRFALDGAVDEHIRLLFKVFCLNSVDKSSFERASDAFSTGYAQLLRIEERASKIIDAAFPE